MLGETAAAGGALDDYWEAFGDLLSESDHQRQLFSR